MTKRTVDPIERAEFWRFWKWQYTCRNPEYVKAYKKDKRLYDPISRLAEKRPVTDRDTAELDKFWDSCREKYGWVPVKNPNHDRDSEKILVGIYKRKLDKKITGYMPYENNIDIWGLENGNIRYTIDFSKPHDQVAAEVKSIYKLETLNQETRQKGMTPSPLQSREIFAELDEYFFSISGEGFKIDWEIRACGLWLWDYVNSHGAKVREAIRKLDKIVDLKESGMGSLNNENTNRRVERYFKQAGDCIKSMKVLPISS